MKGDLVIKKYIKKMYKIKNIVRCQYHTSIVLSRKFCLQITMTISLGMKITITMVVAMHHKCPEVEEVEADHQ